MKIFRGSNGYVMSRNLIKLIVYWIAELFFIFIIHKVKGINIFIKPCIIFNMVRLSKITHIKLIAIKKGINGTCYTKIEIRLKSHQKSIYLELGLSLSYLRLRNLYKNLFQTEFFSNKLPWFSQSFFYALSKIENDDFFNFISD